MSAMVRIFCRGQHGTASDLCAECRRFLDYTDVRLERCWFGEESQRAQTVLCFATSVNAVNRPVS